MGGAIRIQSLNNELSKSNQIYLFSQGIRKSELRFPLRSYDITINNNYTEYRFADTITTAMNYLLGKKRLPQLFAGDILELLNPSTLKKQLDENDIIQVEHPWQLEYAAINNSKNRPIILSEQDIEYELLKQLLPDSSIINKKILEIAKEKEQYAVDNADIIITTSEEDRSSLTTIYGVSKAKSYVIPNGVDINKFKPNTREDKEIAKHYLGIDKYKIVLFSGSAHLPNVRAVERIIQISKKITRTDVKFLIIGSVSNGFKNQGNLLFTGHVDDVVPYFASADIAINPMTSGSGTNLKMLEYFSCGLPVITSDIGARGLDIRNCEDAIIADIDEFPHWIDYLLNDQEQVTRLGRNARYMAEEKYSWEMLSRKLLNVYDKTILDR